LIVAGQPSKDFPFAGIAKMTSKIPETAVFTPRPSDVRYAGRKHGFSTEREIRRPKAIR
jgi:hypothetical protein